MSVVRGDDKRQCIINHLKDFAHQLKEALAHLFEGDVEGAKLHINKAVDLLKDIKNCWFK